MLWWLLVLAAVPVLFVVLVLFLVWPGAPRRRLRQPFCGRSYAHRGLFGAQQRPPENSLPAFAAAAGAGTASSWTCSSPRTASWWSSMTTRWTG